MPKSKELLESDDDLSSGEEKKVNKRAKKQKLEKEEKEENEEEPEENGADGSESEEAPVEKKTKKAPAAAAAKKNGKSEDKNGDVKKDAEGNPMYMLSSNRFVSVSVFRGKPLVNIREYYESNGKLLPGKKGISLAVDQYEQLKKFISKLDEDIKKSK